MVHEGLHRSTEPLRALPTVPAVQVKSGGRGGFGFGCVLVMTDRPSRLLLLLLLLLLREAATHPHTLTLLQSVKAVPRRVLRSGVFPASAASPSAHPGPNSRAHLSFALPVAVAVAVALAGGVTLAVRTSFFVGD